MEPEKKTRKQGKKEKTVGALKFKRRKPSTSEAAEKKASAGDPGREKGLVASVSTPCVTTVEPNLFARRPVSSQPPRSRASICVVSSSSSNNNNKNNNNTDYDPDDPDWEEMSQYYEKRAAYSCNDIDTASKPLIALPSTQPWSAPTPTTKNDDAGKKLDPVAYTSYGRNGLLNERRDPAANYAHCFVCGGTPPDGRLTTLTALTEHVVVDNRKAPCAVYRHINICYPCQARRDLLQPLIRLAPESLALFEPLFLA